MKTAKEKLRKVLLEGVYEDAYIDQHRREGSERRVEAKRWLNVNKNENLFASNAFDERSLFETLVAKLYELGATKVLVSNIYDEPTRFKSEGGEYADTLFIQADEGTLQSIKNYVDEDFYPDESDIENGELRLWWD